MDKVSWGTSHKSAEFLPSKCRGVVSFGGAGSLLGHQCHTSPVDARGRSEIEQDYDSASLAAGRQYFIESPEAALQ